MFREDLHWWLARGRNWHIEYEGYLSNHIAHNWVVLGVAGVPDEKMQWWEDIYKDKLDRAPAARTGQSESQQGKAQNHKRITTNNWDQHLQSSRSDYYAFRDFFDAELDALGMSRTLNRYLPTLLKGLSGAALHPLIHTGFAVDVKNTKMLAEGLAYLATANQQLAISAAHSPPTPLWSSEGVDAFPSAVEFLKHSDAAKLTAETIRASKSDAYQSLGLGKFQLRLISFDDPDLPMAQALNATGPLQLPPCTAQLTPSLEDFTALGSAFVFASNNEFFMVHGLNSLYALLCLLPHLDPPDRREALCYWWRTFMAIAIAQDRPGIDMVEMILNAWSEDKKTAAHPIHRLDMDEATWWQSALDAAVTSTDEHVPKAVYALWRMSAWECFSKPTASLFADTAKNLIKESGTGDLADNLWFAGQQLAESRLDNWKYG